MKYCMSWMMKYYYILFGSVKLILLMVLLLSMGVIFSLMGGIHQWFPLFYGYGFNEFLSKAHFFIMFIGVNLTFFPQHFLGLAGMPRRYTDYPDSLLKWNMMSSVGSMISFVGALFFMYIMWECLVFKRPIVFAFNKSISMEFQGGFFPPSYHNLSEVSWLAISKD